MADFSPVESVKGGFPRNGRGISRRMRKDFDTRDAFAAEIVP
jgi:hypothetical protein